MSAIRIRRTIDSDTLHLPELVSLIGRTVDIVIEDGSAADGPPSRITPGTGDWDHALAAIQKLHDYDYDAQGDQDACDVRDVQERLS
ncbi:MAG TPA: hypothetical protein VFC78_05675 [Tepidisphaeraceae bacterium]|nr:hypothetical protein [Tepidisphaeraceae bacterium]